METDSSCFVMSPDPLVLLTRGSFVGRGWVLFIGISGKLPWCHCAVGSKEKRPSPKLRDGPSGR